MKKKKKKVCENGINRKRPTNEKVGVFGRLDHQQQRKFQWQMIVGMAQVLTGEQVRDDDDLGGDGMVEGWLTRNEDLRFIIFQYIL